MENEIKTAITQTLSKLERKCNSFLSIGNGKYPIINERNISVLFSESLAQGFNDGEASYEYPFNGSNERYDSIVISNSQKKLFIIEAKEGALPKSQSAIQNSSRYSADIGKLEDISEMLKFSKSGFTVYQIFLIGSDSDEEMPTELAKFLSNNNFNIKSDSIESNSLKYFVAACYKELDIGESFTKILNRNPALLELVKRRIGITNPKDAQ